MYASCQMRIAAKNCGVGNSTQPLHTDFRGCSSLEKRGRQISPFTQFKWHFQYNQNTLVLDSSLHNF